MFNFGYIEGYVTMIEFTIYEFCEKWRGHSFLLGATYGAKTSDFHVLNRGQLVSNFTVALIKHLVCMSLIIVGIQWAFIRGPNYTHNFAQGVAARCALLRRRRRPH